MSDWLNIIVAAAQSEWNHRRALNLAKIPNIIARHGLDYKPLLSGRGLREVLSITGGQELKLVNHPKEPLVWGVLPASVDISGLDLASLFDKEVTQNGKVPRFKRAFWTAFIKQMQDGERRFITNDGSFINLQTNNIPELSWIEVLPSDLVETDLLSSDDYDRAVLNKIKEWCARNSVEIERYFMQQSSKVESHRETKIEFAKIDFSSLSEADLARISIPLDIVMKLMKR
ncbi:hypothetical protein [Methylobacterium currus]|uniref:hypothetical protein n=1 Tax=Methylobacterium currus TaxID=2051553 RepID=UPI000F4F75BA|nr:hypothetical protein [Methylobacterium currus]